MIFDEIENRFHHRHHDQEHPVTSSLADAAAILGETASNQLISALAEHRLGKMLTPQEINVVCTLVATLERPRATATGPMPQQNDTPDAAETTAQPAVTA